MKQVRLFCNAIFSLALAGFMNWSCIKEETDLVQEESRTVYTAQMVFNGSLTTYDAPTRAESSSWDDHSLVFLQFSVGDKFVEGAAVYDASTDKWGVEYYNPITVGQELRCHAYYFVNPVQIGGSDVTINEMTAVYRDTSATYFYDGSVLVLNAHLVPITGRVRFEGEPGAACCLAGASRYTSYNFSKNALTATPKELKFNLPESGKSDYFYLFFDEYTPRELFFYDRDNNAKYTKKCSPGILANGRSGYMTVPTVDDHAGWGYNELVKTFQVDTVTFRMILVDKGTFNMGQGYKTQADTVHRVTLTKDYYIAETEVTQALYGAVMRTSVTAGKEDYPQGGVTWNRVVEFIAELNHLIDGAEFRLPTEAEWEFAAKGGNQSMGYEYSGSFDLYRVGWNIGSSSHQVKTKEPNELGIYDMSGNVSEWCYDWYTSKYQSHHQIDPTGPTAGSSRVHRGGDCNHDASYCTCTFRDYYSPSYSNSDLGFRLASY